MEPTSVGPTVEKLSDLFDLFDGSFKPNGERGTFCR